jgi:hypothetical protein
LLGLAWWTASVSQISTLETVIERKKKPRKKPLGRDEPVKLPDKDPEDVIRALLNVPRDQATNEEADDSDRDGR